MSYTVQTQYTTIRDITRNNKQLKAELEKTKEPIIVVSNKKPQFALIALDQLDRFKKNKETFYLDNLLKLAELAETKGIDKATDLSEKLDEYVYNTLEK